MDDLTHPALTMSSLELSELVESRHDNVKVTIERLAERGVISLPAMQEVKVQRERRAETVGVYLVGKRDSYVVVAQLSPEFTARLVDRWQELEAQAAQGLFKPARAADAALAERRSAEALRITVQAVAALADKFPHLCQQSQQIILSSALERIGFPALPRPEVERTWSATEVGELLGGVTAAKIGTIANRHGLKTEANGRVVLDKSRHSAKQVESFRYNEHGVQALRAALAAEKLQ